MDDTFDVILLNNLTDRLGRKYQLNEVEKQIKDKVFFGQIGIPMSIGIELDKVSHSISDLRIENENVVGTVKILDTPNGMILREIGDKINVRMSMSSFGRLTGNEVSDLEIKSFNVVKEEE